MKLYKYNDIQRGYGYKDERLTIGYITEKKVDDFNEAIKVFIPVGFFDLGISFRADVKGVHIWDEIDEDDGWVHLSGLDLEDVTKKEYKAIREYMLSRIEYFDNASDKMDDLLREVATDYE